MLNSYLNPGDPLVLTLAADARLNPTSYVNDHIWELNLGQGEPPALSIQTTFGLRARIFRIFPRFIIRDEIHFDPATFVRPIQIKYLSTNYLRLSCVPFLSINVEIEYWVPTSQTLAGRTQVHNIRGEPVSIGIEWATLLIPDSSGQRMAPLNIGLTHLLAGKTGNLTPIFYVTGIVQPANGPYPGIATSFELLPQQTRQIEWVTAALDTPESSYAQAHEVALREWDAEIARIELTNTNQLEIHTGNPDWDTAFALAQKSARSLIVTNLNGCINPSTVSTRLPDQGYSLRGDGSDYGHLWEGQTLFDLYYLFDLIMPGEAKLVRGFLENFLENLTANGEIPRISGKGDQFNRLAAPPLLSVLVWRYYQFTNDVDFIERSFPQLLTSLQAWFSPQHDRDGDGIPEWDHLLQTGIDDHPIFGYWQSWAQGWDISIVEGPDLCAYLYAEIHALIEMAKLVNQLDTIPGLVSLSDRQLTNIDKFWNESTSSYQYWDRESHTCSTLEIIGQHQGSGLIQVNTPFEHPVRLLIEIRSKDETTRPAQGFIHGTGATGGHRIEKIMPERFRWHLGVGRYISERIYTNIERIELQGILDSDHATIQTPFLNCREQSLLLPLWAGIPAPARARKLIENTIFNNRLYLGKYGLRSCAEKPPLHSAINSFHTVHPFWNSLVGEGLLRYGRQKRAANLVSRLMDAIILNLKQKHSFFRGYSATNGEGIGERNFGLGLAPLGLFLKVLGVHISDPYRVKISAPNPFPWPITVKYKGLTVIQHKKKAMIIFPDGQSVTIRNDQPKLVSLID